MSLNFSTNLLRTRSDIYNHLLFLIIKNNKNKKEERTERTERTETRKKKETKKI
jgi:hypothetical protein